MPMIGISKPSSRIRPRSAGKICLNARSPVAPKKTNASDRSAATRSAFRFDVPAEAEAHGGEDLAREIGLAPGREARIERRRQDGCRGGRVDRGDARPAALA